ncbi:hypothetical protein J3R03_010125 [Actinoplanes couchii]|nr:hypothetical protein [Actinoplanes couchii]
MAVRRPLGSRALKNRLVTRRFGARRRARLRFTPRWPCQRWPLEKEQWPLEDAGR